MIISLIIAISCLILIGRACFKKEMPSKKTSSKNVLAKIKGKSSITQHKGADTYFLTLHYADMSINQNVSKALFDAFNVDDKVTVTIHETVFEDNSLNYTTASDMILVS